MKQTADRQYTTYLALTGATPERGGLVPTHLRIDVAHWTGEGIYLSLNGVERSANGMESMNLTSERARRVLLEPTPRFNRKNLEHWAECSAEGIREERGIVWERIVAVVQAHGGAIAK